MILEKKTDIGLYRKKNEDFVHVSSHPDDPVSRRWYGWKKKW